MNKANCLLAGLTAVVAAAGLLALGSDSAVSAQAQFNPEPQDCACSKGVDVGSPKAPVILKSCTCGQLQCAVLPAAGQLQCR